MPLIFNNQFALAPRPKLTCLRGAPFVADSSTTHTSVNAILQRTKQGWPFSFSATWSTGKCKCMEQLFFFSVRYLQHPDHLWIFKAAFLKLGFNIKGPRPAKKEGSTIQNKTQQAKIGQVSWENRAKIATSYFPWDTRRGRRGPNTPPYYASDRTLWEKFISQHKPATQHRDGLHSDMPISPPLPYTQNSMQLTWQIPKHKKLLAYSVPGLY